MTISEKILVGTCCSFCGCFFKEDSKEIIEETDFFTHGFPVACNECWEKLSDAQQDKFPKATVSIY